MAKDFRILAQVNPDQLSYLGDSVGHVNGSVEAKHKWNSDDRPFCVANEYICSELGRFIGLPIPPCTVTYPDPIKLKDVTIKFFISSIKIDFGGLDENPVYGEFIVEAQPKLAAGIMMFDVFVANADRHNENLVVDDLRRPKRISVIDQDGALFGHRLPPAKCGVPRLKEMTKSLGCTGGPKTAGQRNELIDHFASNDHFGFWCDRIREIPRRFISRLCNEARKYGLTADQSKEAIKFLSNRRSDLRGIVNSHKKQFKSIKKWRSL